MSRFAIRPGREEFHALAAEHTVVPLWTEVLADLETPVSAFLKLVGEGEGPKAEFVISGEYEVFAKISRAELGAQKALMGGLLKLKGNMVKALKLASLVDRLNKIIATIETEY